MPSHAMQKSWSRKPSGPFSIHDAALPKHYRADNKGQVEGPCVLAEVGENIDGERVYSRCVVWVRKRVRALKM